MIALLMRVILKLRSGTQSGTGISSLKIKNFVKNFHNERKITNSHA
jgi:hypothetical protein